MALLTESLILDLGILLLGLAGTIYFFFTRNFNHWKNLGIPYLQPIPIVGNFKETVLGRKHISHCLLEAYREAKNKPFIGIFAFDQPILVVKDNELIKRILVKDFHYFPDHIFHPDERLDPLLSKGLAGLKDRKWKDLRLKLNPAFTPGKIKMMFDLVDACGKDLVHYLDREMLTGGAVEMKEAAARYTTDVIASCAFGVEANSLKDSNAEFRTFLRKIFECTIIKNIKVVAAFFAPRILTLFKCQIIGDDINSFFRNTVWDIVNYREKNGNNRKDFLELLMQIRKSGNLEKNDDSSVESYPFDGDDFVAQSFMFLAAGFETSSTTMSFALYEMAINTTIQHRLREEILCVLEENDGQLNYECLQKMEYLDMVVKETLRKYPVLSFLDRTVSKDYTLPGSKIVLKKGSSVMIPVIGIHMDPKYYPEPEVFNPDRFTEENEKKRPSHTYLPFSEGPRICIGMRMAFMQVKVGLVYVLSNYELEATKETSIPLVMDPRVFLLCSKEGLNFKLKKIR